MICLLSNQFKPSSIVLLTVRLWILFVVTVVFRVCLPFCLRFSLQLLGKGQPLDCLDFNVFLSFITFSYGVLGQVWYLIVSIPDICLLFYLEHEGVCQTFFVEIETEMENIQTAIPVKNETFLQSTLITSHVVDPAEGWGGMEITSCFRFPKKNWYGTDTP